MNRGQITPENAVEMARRGHPTRKAGAALRRLRQIPDGARVNPVRLAELRAELDRLGRSA